MAALNKCMFIGYITTDIELKYTQAGMAVCNFNIGVNNTYKKNNETIKETLFIKIVVWNKQAENCQQYLKKGSLVFVEGRLDRKEYTDDSGNKKTTYSVIAEKIQFLDKKTGSSENNIEQEPQSSENYSDSQLPF